MDNCSAHRGQKAVNRLRDKWPNVILIHTPVHASWLNQVEIYFSIVQRKVLTPNDFSSSQELKMVSGELGGNEGGWKKLIAESGGLFLDFGKDGFVHFELVGGRVGFAVLFFVFEQMVDKAG